MASEQLARRENTTTEREIHVEKDRVPKMTTHFEHLAEQAKDSDITGGKETPQGSIEALQGGEQCKDHAGKAIGDIGGRGKARETHELGPHFESLADKVKGEDHKGKESDHAANVEAMQEREGGDAVRDVGKFETKGETEEALDRDKRDKENLERRTREVTGRGTEEKVKGRVGAENEGATAVITCRLEKGDKGREESENTQQNMKDRYERAKQQANETLNNTTQKSMQAKDIAIQKASSAAKTAAEYTAPVAEKAKGYTLQAKDVTVESGKSAAEYAGKMASNLKDKATVAGWVAAHYSTEKTVEGTKAAAHVVEGAAGYAGHKAAELASKSVGAVKGLAASAGETAKDYTARKKDEAQREFEAKRASQPQEAEERPPDGETVSQNAQKTKPGQEGRGSNVLTAIGETVGSVGEKIMKPFEREGRRESGNDQSGEKGTLRSIGERLGDVAKKTKEPLDNITEGGGEVLEAAGETVGEIGNNMIKPAEKVQEHQQGQEGQGGGVLGAIGETIVEIAQTTKVMVTGEGERESSRKSVGSDSRSTNRAKHEGSQT
ncbi:seed biotin-containing protein SBP65-like [Abrus precatorius]|uniref:Seed biotin-containing protein SBP65-like n=1 Tax=Abrus precatorius TaxID=3816 RepID=A0A8B8KHM8_ABRPR|nr:seed biotin-containing protein SBP65-like [Abrus precatorius]